METRISDKVIEKSRYAINRKDRNRAGGGVAIYYRDCLCIKNREDLVPDSIEAVCFEIQKTKCAPLLVTTRPPSSRVDIFGKFVKLIQNLDSENKEVILVGDVNCDFLARTPSHNTNRLLGITNLFQVTQIITESTSTLIDWFLTNKKENICNSGVLHLGISDHSLIYGCRKIA